MRIIRGLINVSSDVFVDNARSWATELEDSLARRTGQTVEAARRTIAGSIGQAPGTLYNLRNRRLKDVGAKLYLGLRQALINELREEMNRLEHKIAVLEAVGDGADEVDLDAAKAMLAEVQTTLGATGR
jgi:hypothetical protein